MYSVKCITNENDVKIVKDAYKEMAKGHCKKCYEWNEPCNVVHMGLCGNNQLIYNIYSDTRIEIVFVFFAGKHELPLSTQSYNLLQRADEARRNRNSGRMEMPCHILFYVSFVVIVTKKLMF